MPDSATILLVDDEEAVQKLLTYPLEHEGFRVLQARDGEEALLQFAGERVDLVVLDLMLPQRDGLELLDELVQHRPGLPVVVLTARGEIEDRVQGLHAGAVDYMVKPFAVAELDARIRAQLRAARQTPATTLRRAGLELDLISRRVRSNGQTVRLSNTEFELLAYLMQHPGRVLTREQIHRAVWGYKHDPATNIVDVYIGYLRRKLRTDGHAVPIRTVRARGYQLEAQP
jgi:DNA-binding response OmpR family regulator